MKVYLLNSPVLTAYGLYDFSGPVSESHVKSRLANGFVSAVGHESTARLLSHLLGVRVNVDRTRIEMKPGDIAVIFRLLERIPVGEIDSVQQLERTPYEMAILERIS